MSGMSRALARLLDLLAFDIGPSGVVAFVVGHDDETIDCCICADDDAVEERSHLLLDLYAGDATAVLFATVRPGAPDVRHGERARLKRQRHFVHQHRDAGFDTDAEGKRADATQGNVGIDRMLGRPDGQRRRELAELRKLRDARCLQRIFIDDRNGERHFLEILCALVRGDDNLFERSRGGRVGSIGRSRRLGNAA